MPRGDGTGPSGGGLGQTNRGMGRDSGRGRMGGNRSGVGPKWKLYLSKLWNENTPSGRRSMLFCKLS